MAKPNHNSRRVMAVAAVFTVTGFGLTRSTSAASLYWDINAATAGITDGTGNWDTATTNFNTTTTGSTNVAWNNTANAADIAVFGASQSGTTANPGGTVTLAAGGITAGGLSFVGANFTNPYILSGGPLTLTGAASTISLTSASFSPKATISSAITATALNITPTSAANYSYLTLSGTNTYAGGTTVGNAVVLSVGNNSALGTGAVTVGTFFNLNSTVTTTLANAISFGANGMTQNGGSTLRLNGNLTGTGGFTKTGTNELTLAGSNGSYSGTTTVQGAGTLRVATNDNALGTGSVAFTGTANTATSATLATQSGGGARILANNIAVTNNGTGATTLIVDGGYATLTLNGMISGSGTLNKASSGTVNLGGLNSYAGGTTIAAGTLQLASAGTLGTGAVSIANGATLGFSGTGNVLANNIGGAGAVSTTNGGQTFSGNNAYTGSTYIGAGSLTLVNGFSTNLSATSKVSLGYSNVYTSTIIDSAAGTDSTAVPIVLTGNGGLTYNGTGLTASGTLTNSDTNTKLMTLGGTGTASYTGAIGGGGTGAINLAKSGAGTWTLGGTNTYTGNTTVSAGTLTLANTSSEAFVIGASGTNNAFNGAGGLNANGVFNLNLTAADTTLGSAWQLIASTLATTYGSTFSVAGFTASANNTLWTRTIDASTQYQFSETSGALSVVSVPEPASLSLFGLGAVGLLRRRRASR